jgi:hypothetical protein
MQAKCKTELVNKSLAHRVVVCSVAEPSANVDTEELGSQAHRVVVCSVAEPSAHVDTEELGSQAH